MQVVPWVLIASILMSGCVARPQQADPVESAGEPAIVADPAAAVAPVEPGEPGPTLVAWNLTGELRMGYVAAFGMFMTTTGTTDAEHCADSILVVPEGALIITLRLDGEIVDPTRTSAGSQYLWVTPPEGDGFQLDPLLFEGNPLEAPPRERTFEAPIAGEWLAHMQAFGPVLGQSWLFTVVMSGASAEAPLADALLTCNDS